MWKMDHAIHSILTRKKNQTSDLEKMIGQKVSNSVPFVLSYSWVARIVLHQVQLLVQYQSQAEVEGHEGHCCSLISWVALLLLYLYHQGLCHGNSPNPQPLHKRKRSRITQDMDFIKPINLCWWDPNWQLFGFHLLAACYTNGNWLRRKLLKIPCKRQFKTQPRFFVRGGGEYNQWPYTKDQDMVEKSVRSKRGGYEDIYYPPIPHPPPPKSWQDSELSSLAY